MDRTFYLDMAAQGLAFPIGADLVVHEAPDARAIMLDGQKLGEAVAEAAKRYRAPVGFPLMDLGLEKNFLLKQFGIPDDRRDAYHFAACPSDEECQKALRGLAGALSPRMQATCKAIEYVARRTTLAPMGMCIGPFSLTTKLLSDPITAVYLLGTGISAQEEPSIELARRMMSLACETIRTFIDAQIDAGAKAMIVCEPAANKIYLSPHQLKPGMTLFDEVVMNNLRSLKQRLDDRNVDLMLHNCGEIEASMIGRFAELDPAILSLGSSRKLWEDAALTPKSTVLYGNLPSKHFYSDAMITRTQVVERSRDLRRRMKAIGHPFVLGSECDVLYVPGSVETITDKVNAFVHD
ncbi:MAG: uroporphyrinogen decarboxylase family protein, partial [Kiritimatiellia bacterium]